MTSRKQAVSSQEIRKGFRVAESRRDRRNDKLDFKLKKVEESQAKFGNEALCQTAVWDSTGV